MVQEFAQLEIKVVISSPFLRCVQTALIVAEECQAEAVLLDEELGEVFGPAVFESEVPWPPRDWTVLLKTLEAMGCRCDRLSLEERGSGKLGRILGRRPQWPETIQAARVRYAKRFLDYMRRCRHTRRNCILVSHGHMLPVCVSILPELQDRKVASVEYGAALAEGPAPEGATEPPSPPRRGRSATRWAEGAEVQDELEEKNELLLSLNYTWSVWWQGLRFMKDDSLSGGGVQQLHAKRKHLGQSWQDVLRLLGSLPSLAEFPFSAARSVASERSSGSEVSFASRAHTASSLAAFREPSQLAQLPEAEAYVYVPLPPRSRAASSGSDGSPLSSGLKLKANSLAARRKFSKENQGATGDPGGFDLEVGKQVHWSLEDAGRCLMRFTLFDWQGLRDRPEPNPFESGAWHRERWLEKLHPAPVLELDSAASLRLALMALASEAQRLDAISKLAPVRVAKGARIEDAYLVSILPKMAQLEEIQLMRMLGRWAARSLPVPSELQPHLQRCVQMVQRIQDLEVKLQLILEALDRPHHSEAFVQKACGVYLQLLEYLENPTSGQVEQLTKQLVSERKEVKSDIAFVKDRLTSLRKRHRILRCLAPSRTAVAAMTAKELRLCLQIHELPDRGFRERQDRRSSPPWRQPQKPWAPSIMAGMGLTSLEAKTVLVFRPRGGSISTKGRQGQEHTRKSEMRTEAWKCPTSREEMQPAVCAKQVLDWWPYSSPAPLPKVKLKRR
eukprot:g21543.t1